MLGIETFINHTVKDITIASSVIAALREVLGPQSNPVPLHEPCFRGQEWDYVQECLGSGWVSSVGRYVEKFEKQLHDFTGSPFVVATGTGTSALHICLALRNIGPQDEVLVPALSFVATANAVAYTGATPHFVDIEMDSLGMCPVALESYLRGVAVLRGRKFFNRKTGRRLAALLPVHVFGHPCRIEALADLAARYRMDLVEDAAESLGSKSRGKPTGTFGVTAALSFNGNKIITTGGGGAILTADPVLAAQARHLTTQAKLTHPWEYRHDAIGYNYRLPNLNAALGCAQLEQLPAFLASKHKLASRYARVFEPLKEVRFVSEPTGTQSNYWLCTLALEKSNLPLLTCLLEETNKSGIMTRPAWNLLSELPMYRCSPRAPLPVATDAIGRLINIPSSPHHCLDALSP